MVSQILKLQEIEFDELYPIVDLVWFITYIVFLDAKFVNENSPSCHISSNIFARIQVISPTNVDIQAAPKPFRNYQIYSRTPGKVYYQQAARYISYYELWSILYLNFIMWNLL